MSDRTRPASAAPLEAEGLGTAIPLVAALVSALEERGIAWCQWKSTIHLDRAATALSDLDLLVRRANADAYFEVLSSLGFKEARSRKGEQLPGVLHHFGHDPAAERLVHVHTHFHLVVGHDRTKGYRIPLEEPYLAEARFREALRVPLPELEWIAYVLRMALKLGSPERVLTGQGVPRAVRDEEIWLRSLCDPEEIERFRGGWLPFVPAALLRACAGALAPGASAVARLRAGRGVHRALRSHSRRSRGADVALTLARRAARAVRRRAGGTARLGLASGGALIAIVGGDGAGKSTAIDGLRRWLSRDLDVRCVHLGRPPRSGTTRAARAALRIARSAGLPLDRFSHMVWSVCAARDRYRVYRRARRLATNGTIVLCDRYPIPGVHLMDAPAVARIRGSDPETAISRWLARTERACYREIVRPDLLIVLRLAPDEAVRRRWEDPAETVRPRSTEIWEHDWRGTGAIVVDASPPAGEVLARLKSIVWAAL